MKEHIKQLNATFNEKQKMIAKENSKLYSDTVSIVSSENLNTVAYLDVMIRIMDEIIRCQKKRIPTEEIFGGKTEEYVRNLCKDKPKKKTIETVLEALNVLGYVFCAGFLAGIFLIGKEMSISVLSIIRWSVLLVVGLFAMIYLQRKKMRSQMTMMLLIMFVYMTASNTVDVLFKNFTDIPVKANTYLLTLFFGLLGFISSVLKNRIRDEEYRKSKSRK